MSREAVVVAIRCTAGWGQGITGTFSSIESIIFFCPGRTEFVGIACLLLDLGFHIVCNQFQIVQQLSIKLFRNALNVFPFYACLLSWNLNNILDTCFEGQSLLLPLFIFALSLVNVNTVPSRLVNIYLKYLLWQPRTENNSWLTVKKPEAYLNIYKLWTFTITHTTRPAVTDHSYHCSRHDCSRLYSAEEDMPAAGLSPHFSIQIYSCFLPAQWWH